MIIKIGNIWRRIKPVWLWIFTELPISPILQIYSKIVDRDNISLTRRLRSGGSTAFSEYVASYLHKDIPKIIWIFWAQGEADAPFLVKFCIESWREKNPEWDVRVLDDNNVGEFVDISMINRRLPFRFHADYLRLVLLQKFGGVWTDATTLCHRPLSEWLPLLGGQTGFFVFRGPHHDRWLDNWFIAASRENILVNPWADSYKTYVTRLRRTPSIYFAMIYVIQLRIILNKELRLAFRASGGLPAVPSFFLQGFLDGNCAIGPFNDALEAGLPVSKLNWRTSLSDYELKCYFQSIL